MDSFDAGEDFTSSILSRLVGTDGNLLDNLVVQHVGLFLTPGGGMGLGWAVAKASMANPSQRYLPNGARAQHRGTFLGSRLRRQPMDLLTCSDGPRQGADVWAK